MEGLIPFIYKAVKERQRRGYSRCSSTFGVRPHDGDVDVWEQHNKRWAAPTTRKEEADDGGRVRAEGETETAHRRHRSLEDLAGEVGASPTWRAGAMALPRGRSVVGIFSCVSARHVIV